MLASKRMKGGKDMTGARMRGPFLRHLLRLYRPRDWLHFLPLPMVGWFASEGRCVGVLLGAMTAWGLALAYMSALNHAFDDKLDRRDDKNPVGVHFGRRQAVFLSLPPAIAAVAVSARFAPAGLVPLVLVLVASTVYSAPPRLKCVPVLSTLWNVVIAFPSLLLADFPRAAGAQFRSMAGVFALLLVVSQLIHEAEDREDDRIGGVRTVAVLVGRRGALATASLCLAALPLTTWCLAAGLTHRTSLVILVTAFALGWIAALSARIVTGHEAGLRRVRLHYRYASLTLGALAFLLARP